MLTRLISDTIVLTAHGKPVAVPCLPRSYSIPPASLPSLSETAKTSREEGSANLLRKLFRFGLSARKVGPRRVPCGSGSWGIPQHYTGHNHNRQRVQRLFFVYTGSLHDDIEDALSSNRLSVYRNATANDLEKAVDLYCWNAALGSALFAPIGVLEVVLRNALDRELSRGFTEPWYDDESFLRIDPKFRVRIQDAKNEITKRGKALIHPRVIAELSFGFWVHLLRPGPSGAYVRTLWGPALSKAFPSGTKRSQVVGVLDPLHRFRNRVAHHEPIFAKDAALQYGAVLFLLRLLAPTLVPWVEHHSRVRQLLALGPYPARSMF
jgi:hypothetical protein